MRQHNNLRQVGLYNILLSMNNLRLTIHEKTILKNSKNIKMQHIYLLFLQFIWQMNHPHPIVLIEHLDTELTIVNVLAFVQIVCITFQKCIKYICIPSVLTCPPFYILCSLLSFSYSFCFNICIEITLFVMFTSISSVMLAAGYIRPIGLNI